jgi:hypothetical protein
MKRINLLFSVLTVLCFVDISCTNELDKRIQRVNYGTSFGECVGYCRKQWTVTIDSVHFTAFCNACMTPAPARKDLYLTPTKQQWDTLRSNISVSEFNTLPTVIGCPDCADGGAEWLELILSNGETHKVTFEYMNEPTALKQYIPILRKMLNRESLQ